MPLRSGSPAAVLNPPLSEPDGERCGDLHRSPTTRLLPRRGGLMTPVLLALHNNELAGRAFGIR
jgi:hypothetical protein